MKSAAAALAILPAADAHSWLHCMKFLGDVPRPQDDETLCQGWPRGWPQFARNNGNRAFGQDIGRDNRPGRDVSPTITCDQSETVQAGEGAYGTNGQGGNGHGPRAIIAAGDEFIATWPAKNHCDVGAQRGCQMFFAGPKTSPTDPDDWAGPLTAVGGNTAGFEAAYPGLTRTYSKCTPQAGGVDRAFCYGRYIMPEGFAEGFYGFMWWWEFNRGEHYNSCAGVQVVSQTNRALADAQGTPAPTPPPGTPGADPVTPPMAPPGGAACPPGGGSNGQPYTCNNFDCTQFHNCCPGGFTCYRKNEFYSGCRNDQCTPGTINNNDPPQFRTPWECVALGGVCNEQTRANSVMAMGMEMQLVMANANLSPASTELGGMDPQMAAFTEASKAMAPAMAAQIVGMDPAMMPGMGAPGMGAPGMGAAPMMPPVGAPVAPAPVMPPVAPAPVMPVAPVAPAPVVRPSAATPPAAVSGAYKMIGSALLPLVALLRW